MRQKAFTMVELMLVVVLLAIGFGFVVLFTQTSQVRADINTQAASLVSDLRLSQSNAFAGKSTQSYGLHLETSGYTVFVGSTYDLNDPSNYVVSFPPNLEVQNISLNGGGSSVIFDPPHGKTDEYGSFDLVSTALGKTIIITINPLGSVDY